MNKPRVLFAGTPEFARASLMVLCDNGFQPIAVLTQPDRPAGRGKQLQASAVKKLAIEKDIDVLQPTTLRDDAVVDQLKQLAPDVMIVAAYGLILPQAVLDVPKLGCLNVHASLLPRWRGAAPIQAAIVHGDAQTGISLMSMTAGLDCGPVYVKRAIDIGLEETAGELHDRLAILGGDLLVRELAAILAGERHADEQDDAKASYAPKISTGDARLDWNLDARQLLRNIRAFNPVPGAWCLLGSERIKCWKAHQDSASGAPGNVLGASEAGIVVACRDTSVAITELQRPGKRRVSAAEFAAQIDVVGKAPD